MQCPLCRSERASVLDGRLSVRRCPSCTHLFTPSQLGNEEQYDEQYFQEEHPNWFAHPDRAFFHEVHRTVRRTLGAGRLRLLDVGCGTGDFLRAIRERDPNIVLYGIDLVPNAEEGIHYIQGDIYTASLPGPFDAIFCSHTIEHVADPHRFVSILQQNLKPGGLLFLATIDSSSFIHILARILRHVGLRAAFDRIFSSHHVQHFNFRTLRTLLESHGFIVQEHFHYNHPLRSVDVPGKGFVYAFHKLVIAVLFPLIRLWGGGMLQAIVAVTPLHTSDTVPPSRMQKEALAVKR